VLVVTKELYDEWKVNPITVRLMQKLRQEREEMKEGLVYGNYAEEEEVKGRCRAIALLLDLQYEDLFDTLPKEKASE